MLKSDKKKIQTSYLAQSATAISIAFEIGFIIALPVTVLALIGKHLDSKYHTHFIVYIAMVIALGFSGLWLYLRLEELVRKLKISSTIQKSDITKTDSEQSITKENPDQ